MFATLRTSVQGRAGFGLRLDAPEFPGERGGFMRQNDEGSGQLCEVAAPSAVIGTISARYTHLAPAIMAACRHCPRNPLEDVE
jgi:hypothetical protein